MVWNGPFDSWWCLSNICPAERQSLNPGGWIHTPLQIRSWKDPSVRRITGATDKTHDVWILLAASVSGSRCCASRDLQGRLKRRKPLLVLRVKAVLFQIRRGYVKDLLEAIFFSNTNSSSEWSVVDAAAHWPDRMLILDDAAKALIIFRHLWNACAIFKSNLFPQYLRRDPSYVRQVIKSDLSFNLV